MRRLAIATAAAAVAVIALYAVLEQSPMEDAAPVASPEQIRSLTDANNEFAVDFYKQVSDDDKNIFFSPTSMHVAFSALYEGAEHDTADQIQQTFRFEPDADTRRDSIKQFLLHINQEDPHSTLTMANALWLAEEFEVYDTYVEPVQEYYGAYVEALDLPGIGAERINKWAAENTNDTIDEVITSEQLQDLAVMVITNAIYFAGEWESQFPLENTRIGAFWKNSEESVEAEIMSNEGSFYHASLDGFQLVKLPYKGDRLSMLIMLPDDRNGIKSLEESLTKDSMELWKKEMEPAGLRVSIPKFKIDADYNLVPSLKNLGMTDVFDPDEADLTGIGVAPVSNLYVQHATQKAFVDVNEVGTEAAAVTTIVVGDESVTPSFTANHPFIFIIQDDETDTILFMGRVADPTA